MTEIDQMVNETNTTIPGVEDYFAEVSAENTSITMNETVQKIGEIAPAAFGARELTGLILIAIIAFGLYKNKAGIDIWLTTMTPTLFVLGQFGFLPYPNTFVTISIIGIAALIARGISQFF